MRIFRKSLNHALFTLLVLFVSCKSSTEQKYTLGARPFHQLRVENITAFDLSRNDPTLNQNWFLHFIKEKNHWVISSTMGTPAIKDNAANDHFINHLLDAITSTQIEEETPNGPLGAFRLDPPTYALKMISPEANYILKIGDPNPNRPQTFFALLTESKPWMISTPAVSLLNSIKNWNSLRKPSITFESPDDIDEITVIKNKKTIFYTQRDGDLWTDEFHHPVQASVEQSLKQLLSHSSSNLIERPETVSHLQRLMKSNPAESYEIKLSGPFIEPIQLILFKAHGKSYLHYSRRSQVYFEISDQLLKNMKSLKKL